jgi:NADH-quinone oxidoreductase subunit C
MTVEEIHKLLLAEFGEKKVTGCNLEAIDPWIEVAVDAIVEVAAYCKHDDRLRFDHLNNLCGVDYLEPDPKKAAKFGHDPHIEVVYHLSSYEHHHRVTVKVKMARWQNDEEGQLPVVPSVSSVWASADWHEREAYDLMGIDFSGHPNMRRILCPDDWVGHPLRKDYEFPLEYHGIRG